MVTLLVFWRGPFPPSLLANLFLEQISQTGTGLVQLRLRISHRASHNACDLVMLVSLDVMQHEHRPVARRQLFDRTFEIDPVHGTAQAQIGSTDAFPGP